MLGMLPLDAEAEVRPLDRELVREPVLIDQGYLVRQSSGDWIAHIEAFSDVEQDDVERVLWYATRLAVDTQLPVRSTILLQLDRYAPANFSGSARVERGSVTIEMQAQVVKLWEVPARRLLDTRHPKLLTWTPLAKGGIEEWREAQRYLRDLRDIHLLDAFNVIGSLRYGKDVWEHLLERGIQVITTDTLRKHSWLVQGWIEQGREMGLEEGREKGLEEGREEGREEGVREGLRTLLEVRFPSLAGSVSDLPKALATDRLNDALRKLIGASTEDEARIILEELK